jgi:hypothetical protein
MEHIADHFEDGWTLEESQPDLGVLAEMQSRGCLSVEGSEDWARYPEAPPGLQPSTSHMRVPDGTGVTERISGVNMNRDIDNESPDEERRPLEETWIREGRTWHKSERVV